MISAERLREIAAQLPPILDLTAFARAVEQEAYEAAAKVCEKHTFRSGGIVDECAAAIRTLKGA